MNTTALDNRDQLADTQVLESVNPHAEQHTNEISILTTLVTRVEQLTTSITSLEEQHATTLHALEQLKTEKRVLCDLHGQYTQLREKVFQRETLAPIFRTLIAIGDRCRQETSKLQQTLLDAAKDVDFALAVGAKQVLEARKGDLIEIEACLSGFGVEAFQHINEKFDPRVHRCVKRIATTNPQHHQRIASRLLPGYRRHDHILRPECVEVYVFTDSSLAHKEGVH